MMKAKIQKGFIPFRRRNDYVWNGKWMVFDVDVTEIEIVVFWIPDIYVKFNPYVELDVPEELK